MRIERTKNAKRNIGWGLFERAVALVVPFVCRSAIIRIFGINYAGLNSLFASLLSALNLAELGFGSASVYFLYSAIAEDDKEKICKILAYLKKAYLIVGTVVLTLGLLLVPFLKNFIHSDIPKGINIYIIFLLSLASTVLSYFLFSYRSAIIIAHQRHDVLFRISIAITIIDKGLQLVAIFLFKNYYMYIGSAIVATLINNMLYYFTSSKMFPNYVPSGRLESSVKSAMGKKIGGLLWYKLGSIVSTQADSIVISSFLGLAIMGKYGNYYYVIYFLFMLFSMYYSTIRAGIGNSIALDTVEKNHRDFKVLQFGQSWMISWCTVCLFCLFQDFIAIYAGDKNQLPFGIVVCMCIYFWIWKIQDIVYTYKEASGLWDKDKFRPLISAGTNLLLNICTVKFIGLYGVILSTVVSILVIDIPWSTKVLFAEYFKDGKREYYLSLIKSFAELVSLCAITGFACSFVNIDSTLLRLIVKAAICVIVPNAIILAIHCKSELFSSFIKKIIHTAK
ncbi:MAG: polysaccharide biosynthesis protein [Clostridia bacterium]|nr:polysaccharide biosynthesis protein [Clostridia bacterium]